ncbi:S4 domain-containing protein YaaA [Savagea sp. SN6]|uniref:S4 domain-containing protein YaaA n=1 Tax=Savagea serpentis TaxID=2785297 RepID=A0A8J7KI91_9BACL|nr:S4 domain-containing protein YaaA [Savagea serpentis]MBF4502138.1 S4 domain-containing protein YaaA [Savagea serpentis]
MEKIEINTEYVTLGQFLKMVNVISSGGMAKWYLSEYVIYVNGEEEQRRGKKLYDQDIILVPNEGKFQITRKLG